MIDSKVYDVSKFTKVHPGGANVLYADSVGEPLILLLEKPSIHLSSR